MENTDLNGSQILAGLTEKQRQVLDLLIEHKTSKEIARILGISPHTVDQRIQFAREKLGVCTRSEAAVAYRRLLEASGKALAGPSAPAQTAHEVPAIAAPQPAADELEQARVVVEKPSPRALSGDASPPDVPPTFPTGRDLFEGRHGTLMRLGAIVAIAFLLVLLVLGALATFSQLSQIMAG